MPAHARPVRTLLVALAAGLAVAVPARAGDAAKEATADLSAALEAVQDRCRRLVKSKDLDLRAIAKELAPQARRARTVQDHYAVLVRLVARLEDGHAGVRMAEGAAGTDGLVFPGPVIERGPRLFVWVDGKRVRVKTAWGDAAKAGITAGMEVFAIDGTPAMHWLTERVAALRDTRSFSTERQAEFFARHWGLGGEAGSRLSLELRGLDGKRRKATLKRSSKSLAPWGPAIFPDGLAREGRQAHGRTPGGFGYIHLRDVPRDLPAQLDRMLAGMEDVPGLVLDMRGNGGGGCDHDAVLARFVPAGRTWNHGRRVEGAGPNPYAGPVVVIIDAGVRSAGETVAGFLKEYGRAHVVGPSPTAGMSSSKTVIELPSNRFTLYVSTHSNMGAFNEGRGLEGIGLPPHEVVNYEAADLAGSVDTLIRVAEERLHDGLDVPWDPAAMGWKPAQDSGDDSSPSDR